MSVVGSAATVGVAAMAAIVTARIPASRFGVIRDPPLPEPAANIRDRRTGAAPPGRAQTAALVCAVACIACHSSPTCTRSVSAPPIETRVVQRPSMTAGVR